MWGKAVCLHKGMQKWAQCNGMVILKCRHLGQGNHQLASTDDLARERIMSKDTTKALGGSSLYKLTSQRLSKF